MHLPNRATYYYQLLFKNVSLSSSILYLIFHIFNTDSLFNFYSLVERKLKLIFCLIFFQLFSGLGETGYYQNYLLPN